jgi:murein DD-endopeptidase MepM/ murein hydrolase activator NlpD
MQQWLIGLLSLITIFSLVFTAQHWLQTYSNVEAVVATSTPQVFVTPQDIEKEQEQIHAYYAKRLGSLQAEAIRLKALTDKLAELSGIDSSALMLSDSFAGQGGIDQQGHALTDYDFESGFIELEDDFYTQSKHLTLLQDYFIAEDGIKSAIPSGKPIEGGWISSFYGKRVDPFSGKKVFHYGLDIAGKEGSEVLAVADGSVSWQGKRGAYGELIEIDHGNGYQTRYAHNKKLTVSLGDRIKKGQVIALVGSTGRSTGPHVHFEVLRDGETVNPYIFVKN